MQGTEITHKLRFELTDSLSSTKVEGNCKSFYLSCERFSCGYTDHLRIL